MDQIILALVVALVAWEAIKTAVLVTNVFHMLNKNRKKGKA
jgi:hypothetical protein